jgi:hypothetical protein
MNRMGGVGVWASFCSELLDSARIYPYHSPIPPSLINTIEHSDASQTTTGMNPQAATACRTFQPIPRGGLLS